MMSVCFWFKIKLIIIDFIEDGYDYFWALWTLLVAGPQIAFPLLPTYGWPCLKYPINLIKQ